ncbi:F-box only protein 15-like isoform X2 [Syngnathoides biaculeatus]|uniref:F-box only protein 15-like isoform X2 n=1 Tax=Syngnathoides biaculeatus TaxID=300417 RepID=UPI002ADD777A|nr:F-box only protein 15-like isoform X2 [Syngnathoides biaculeatus]
MATARDKFAGPDLSELDCWFPGGPVAQPNDRHQETGINESRECFTPVEPPETPSLESVLDRLPPEILMTILSYLDAASLLSLSKVNTVFRQLASDNVVWSKIYTANFATDRRMYRPDDRVGEETRMRDSPPGTWKKHFLWKMGGEHLGKWQRATRDVDPFTGMPQRFGSILRNINVLWEVTLEDRLGRRASPPLRAFTVFKTSVALSWGGSRLLRDPDVASIRLSAVHGTRPHAPWRSLVCRTEPRADGRLSGRFLGRDRTVRVVFFPPAFVVGFRRGLKGVAFVTVTLHSSKLLERALLGSPLCPYWQPEEPWGADPGPRLYTVHLSLHDTASEITPPYVSPLHCRPVGGRYLAELRPVHLNGFSHCYPVFENIRFLWKSDSLEGSLENCCVMTLTVQEGFEALWCVSAPVLVAADDQPRKSADDCQRYLLVHDDARGLVKMTLLRLKTQRQLLLVDLLLKVFKSQTRSSYSILNSDD